MTPAQTLGQHLRELREAKGLSLRQVEKATGDYVSNVYLSQLETGRRSEPNPKYLVELSKVYDVPVRLLLEKAGYLEEPTPSELDRAFAQVLADPAFQFGTRFHGGDELDESSKRAIVELYEEATKRKLLPDKLDQTPVEGQDRPGGAG